jgi:nucleolar protein 14
VERERDDSVRHQLDQELDSIRSLLLRPDALSASLEQPNPLVVSSKIEKDQEYDQFVRELVFDKRARPKDRLKTEEELALEEKEKLEKAERKRIRRMNGEDADSSDNEAQGRKRKRPRGGDDLEDDFMGGDDWDGLGAGLQADGDDKSGEEAEEDDGEDEDDDGEEESDKDGSDEEEDEGAESDGNEGGETQPSRRPGPSVRSDFNSTGEVTRSTKRQRTSMSKGLPFTFLCPSSHDEFLELLEDVSDNDVPTVIQRIRALHHPSLGVDNKFKLQVRCIVHLEMASSYIYPWPQTFAGVLVDHVLHLASPPTPRLALLSSILPHIYALTKAYPVQAAEHFVEKISLMSKNLKRGVNHGATKADSKTWPGLPELSLIRTIGAVWPTSDMNHAVITPARLLMGSYLGLCRVRSLQDLACGLFLCTLFLQFEQLSRRLAPEAVNFVANSLLHLAPHRFLDVQSLPGSFPSPDFDAAHCQDLKIDPKVAKKCSSRPPFLDAILTAANNGEQEKLDLIGLAVELVSQFAQQYKDLDGFVELYQPILEVLDGIHGAKLPKAIQVRATGSFIRCRSCLYIISQTKLHDVGDSVRRLLKFSKQSRRPLHLQAHKPIPIPSVIPKFEQTSSSYLHVQDPDHEKNEASKLRREYKQERKGAIRELRKDARFLATVEQEKQKEKDAAYATSMRRVLGSLEGERAEEKAMEREKAREKRRAGKK